MHERERAEQNEDGGVCTNIKLLNARIKSIRPSAEKRGKRTTSERGKDASERALKKEGSISGRCHSHKHEEEN